jgi:hypothetical protein
MFQEKGLIISISLTLLIGALIIYYVMGRFRAIESSIAKQNDILSDFIINVRNEIGGAPSASAQQPDGGATNETREILLSGPASNDATIEAKLAAESYLANKITVSDDEEEEEESDDDSESDSDSDDDSVTETKQINLNPEGASELSQMDDVKVVEVMDASSSEEVVDLSGPPSEYTDLNSVDIADGTSTIKAIKLSDVIAGNVGLVEEMTDLSHDSTFNPTPSSSDVLSDLPYKKRKVEDLRKVVLDNNLTVPAEANKMKKADLLTLIETKLDKVA